MPMVSTTIKHHNASVTQAHTQKHLCLILVIPITVPQYCLCALSFFLRGICSDPWQCRFESATWKLMRFQWNLPKPTQSSGSLWASSLCCPHLLCEEFGAKRYVWTYDISICALLGIASLLLGVFNTLPLVVSLIRVSSYSHLGRIWVFVLI